MIGKRGEYEVIAKLLENGLTVYTPVVDIDEIDCIVRNSKGKLKEIQIKTNDKSEVKNIQFWVKNFKRSWDYFICCYINKTKEMWLIPSLVFGDNSFNTYRNGEKIRVLDMNPANREKLEVYKNNFGILNSVKRP